GEHEARRELAIFARRAQRHGHRRAVDADLERLLDGDTILVGSAVRTPRGNGYTAGHVVLPGTRREGGSPKALEAWLEPISVGRSRAQRHRSGEAQPLSRNGESGVAEPRSAAVRLANSNPRRVRRLRPGDERALRLHDGGRAPVRGAAPAAALEHG